MKKTVLLAFVLVLLLPFIIRFFVPAEAQTKMIYVDADNVGDPLEDGSLIHPFDRIQEGIDAAVPGDTVFVHSGIYYEWYVVLDKNSLSLVGENKDNTVVDGMNFGWILIIAAQNVSVAGFTIQNSPGTTGGIFLNHATKSEIRNNIIENHDTGIYSVFSNSNVIDNNRVSGCYAGIILSRMCRQNRVSNNDVTGNTRGIDLSHHAHHNEIRNNKIFQNTYGVSISHDNNSIFGNQIVDNSVGIYEDLLTGPAQGYRIFHNSFINNTKQIDLRNQSVNIWDNGLEGNYWSIYNETDFNQDGIGDIPYVININNTDNYPLMGTFSDFPVTSEKQTYHVTTICNSTISAFKFYQANKTIRFNVAGEEDTGFCRVCIPYLLMPPPYTVTIDDGQTPVLCYNHSVLDNGTHRWIYFAYEHSTRKVTIQSPPTISILSPENKTYPVDQVPLTYATRARISWVGYSLDGQANVTIAGNTTLSGLSSGSHSLIVYAKDTAGNTGASETIYFSIETQQAEPFPTLIAATIVAIAVVGTALLAYFTKIKKTTEKVKQ